MEDDIRNDCSYVIEDETSLRAVFVMIEAPEPTYSVIDGEWLSDAPYITIHRVARDDAGHGIFAQIIDFCRRQSDNIRIDTHQDNHIMQKTRCLAP